METTELIADGSEPGIVQLILNRPAPTERVDAF
jgi:hypothetical protein